MKFEFDKRTFNKGYGYIYTLLQNILILGFADAIIIVVLSAVWGVTCTIPDMLQPIIAVYSLVSIVGFPIVTIIKKGYKRLIKGSTLVVKKNLLIYNKLAEKLWTAVGHVEEHHIYTVLNIDSIKITKFYYILVGDVSKEIINNGRKLDVQSVNLVKIPKAYADMERIKEYGKGNKL